jgi:hypothetical protein
MNGAERGQRILEAEELAWVVLRVANRMQARGSTARLVVPRAPEVAYEVGVELEEDRFLAAEEHLLQQSYVAPADISLSSASYYTITPAGLRWLERGPATPWLSG